MRSPQRYLTREKALGIAVAILAVLGGINTLVGGWDNVQRVNWEWLATVTDSPWFFVGVFIFGIGWVLFVGPPRADAGRDYAMHRGLRWRWQTFNIDAVNPYPYCPSHDVKLLWEADDKYQASWALHDVEDGMWFGPEHNGHLWCSHEAGHALRVEVDTSWMAKQGALEASGLLERASRHRGGIP